MRDFEPGNILEQVPETNKLMRIREALMSLRGPMGNMPAFRKALEAVSYTHLDVYKRQALFHAISNLLHLGRLRAGGSGVLQLTFAAVSFHCTLFRLSDSHDFSSVLARPSLIPCYFHVFHLGRLRGGRQRGPVRGCAPPRPPLHSPRTTPGAFHIPSPNEGCAAPAAGASSLRSAISLRAAQCQQRIG